jgi:hypothetical protein
MPLGNRRSAPPVTTAQLGAMRAATLETLPDTCEVQRLDQVSDDAGGFADAYTTRYTAPCRVWPAGRVQPDEQVLADQLQGRTPLYVTLPHDADVAASDRIVRPSDGLALEVLGGSTATSWRTETRVLCARVS